MAANKPILREKRILTVDSVSRVLFDENDHSEYDPRSSSVSEGFTSGNSSEEDSGPSQKGLKENRTCNISPMVGQDDSSSLSDSEDVLSGDLEISQIIEQQATLYTARTTTNTMTEEDPDLFTIDNWLQHGCSCCKDKFTKEEILAFRIFIQELTKEERDLYLFGKLHVCMVRGDKKLDGHKRALLEWKRTTFRYAFDGDGSLCKSAFLIIHDISEHTLKALSQFIHSEDGCPTVSTHKAKYKPAKNAHSFETVKTVVTFLNNTSTQHGIPQPAAPRGKGEDAPVYLPSSFTKLSIHKTYMEECERTSTPFMKRSSFVSVWNSIMPHLKLMTPRTDVCRQCEILCYSVMNTTSEDDKISQMKKFQNHIEDAANEREIYMTDARRAVVEVQRSEGGTPKFGHYTFNFAQQLQIFDRKDQNTL